MSTQLLKYSFHSPAASVESSLQDRHGLHRCIPLSRIQKLGSSCYPRSLSSKGDPALLVSHARNPTLGADVPAEDGSRGSSNPVPRKSVDIVTLGNLCVDIVLNVESLPPASPIERKQYMDRLSASPPDKKYWEAGGNCNLAIAAARLGVHCVALGHVGDDPYGYFLEDVLKDQGVDIVSISEDSNAPQSYNDFYKTLLCWVFVDPFQNHGFCSRADFSTDVAFNWIKKLSRPAEMAIQNSRILFCNGYVFDELFPEVIVSALEYARNAGTAVFFDPGPRVRTLSNGDPDQRLALELFLKHSDVLLFTAEEVEILTGISDPICAGKELIKRSTFSKWVIVKLGSKGSVLITKISVSGAPAFKVNVLDTVGCGDSFTAAIAFGLVHKMPAVNTLMLANAVGAATATGCGAGRNVAKLNRVMQLLKLSHLNEDNEFWSWLLEKGIDASEVKIISRHGINGSMKGVTSVLPEIAVREILVKLEDIQNRKLIHLETQT